jgi:hypothetical protein
MLHEPIWYPNKGKPPRDKTVLIGIKWRNGAISKHPSFAPQLRWTLTDSEYDVAYFCRAA